ncbi:MAG TPA: hypothetical protein VGH53_08095, partial [Streptosporangiaceae bacterium]
LPSRIRPADMGRRSRVVLVATVPSPDHPPGSCPHCGLAWRACVSRAVCSGGACGWRAAVVILVGWGHARSDRP